MSILDLKSGDKVIYANDTAGYDMDIETGKKHLVLNQEYTINSMEIDSFHTDITLTEVGPSVNFNSVLFDVVK